MPMSGSEDRPARNITLTSPISTFHTSQLPPSPDVQSISSSDSSSSEFQNIISPLRSGPKGSKTPTEVTSIGSSQEFAPVPSTKNPSTGVGVGVVIGTVTFLILLAVGYLFYRRSMRDRRPPVVEFYRERMVAPRQTPPSAEITSPNVNEKRSTTTTMNSLVPLIESPQELHSQRHSIPFGASNLSNVPATLPSVAPSNE
uniref:Uncharacterized protein n=1 Tax=Moniliophthora roreri TaxID=221103 RepID=A0A0W0EWI2_MONRR